jgi:membrane protease YdiL (CAAX protease family)
MLTSKYRTFSAIEFLLGAFIVIGHNVFHILPNEVPILFVLGLLSVRLRDGRWSAIGFKWPESWMRVVLIALGVAALRICLGDFVIEPLTGKFWPAPVAPAMANEIAGNPKVAADALLIVWTFAAFGEEISYRGYLLRRGAEAGGGSTAANWTAMLLVSVLFGFGHYYKGTSGVIDSGVAGLILGSAYLLSGRNLWVPILAHGFIDTFAVITAFFGLDR